MLCKLGGYKWDGHFFLIIQEYFFFYEKSSSLLTFVWMYYHDHLITVKMVICIMGR